jgi:hypothetical protein
MDTTPTKFGEVAPALHARGWRPIPLDESTKIPAEGGWNQRNHTPWPDRDLELAAINHHNAACGVAISRDLFALDLDVIEPSAAGRLEELAEERLGPTPIIRIGQPPKSVWFYGADGTIKSSKPHPVEIYSGSGQVAIYGWHAKANKPYTYVSQSPLDVSPGDLPVLTNQRVIEFLADAAPILVNLRRAGGARTSGVGKDPGEEMGRLLRAGVPFHVAARMILEGAVEGGRHYAVRAVVSQGYNRGLSYDRIHRTITRQAPPELLEHVGDYLDRTLADFEPRKEDWT